MTHKINLDVELTIHSTEPYSYDEWEELKHLIVSEMEIKYSDGSNWIDDVKILIT